MSEPYVNITLESDGPVQPLPIRSTYTFRKCHVVPGTLKLDHTYDEMDYGYPVDLTYYDEKGRAIDLMPDVEGFSSTMNDYVDNTNALARRVIELLIAGALSANDEDFIKRIMQ